MAVCPWKGTSYSAATTRAAPASARVRIALDPRLAREGRRGGAHVVEQVARRGEGSGCRFLPLDLELSRRTDGLLFALADHGHIVATADHAQEPRHVGYGSLVDALQGCACQRWPHIARVHHAGQLHVHGPFLRAVDLGGNVVALERLPHDAQVAHGLDRGLAGGGIDIASGERDVEALAADQLRVGHALRGIGFQRNGSIGNGQHLDRRAEMLASQLEQHAPCLCAHPAHRESIAFDTVGAARATLVRRDVGRTHDELRAVVRDIQLVTHHLPVGGAGALATIRLADEEGGGVVRMDDDPRIQLQEIPVRPRTGTRGLRCEGTDTGHGGDAEADDEGARTHEEAAARRLTEGDDRVLDDAWHWSAHFASPAADFLPTTRLIAAWTR